LHAGIGQPCSVEAPLVRKLFVFLFARIRRSGTLPLYWNTAQCFFLDKHNQKSGPDGMRLIASFDPLAKAYCKVLWSKLKLDVRRPYSWGYQPKKRREHAIMQQSCLAHRLRIARCGAATILYDMRNAFLSSPIQCLCKHIVSSCDPVAAALLRSHLQHVVLLVQPLPFEDAVFLSPQCGVPPGSSIAGFLFLADYHPKLDQWISTSSAHALAVSLPWEVAGTTFPDVSLSSFADDLCRTVAVNSLPQFHRAVRQLDMSLDAAVVPYAQNHSKKEALVKVFGRGSFERQKNITASSHLVGLRVRHVSRYLGTQLHVHGTTSPEVHMRLLAARRIFAVLQPFFRHSPRRLALAVFRSAVVSALFSGLTAFVLSRTDIVEMDRFVAKCLRFIFGRSACHVPADDDDHYRRDSNQELFRRATWAGAALELSILRLRFWQQVCLQAPSGQYDALLGVVFGTFSWQPPVLDAAGRLIAAASRSVSPWATQLAADIELLSPFDSCASFFELYDGSLSSLWTNREVAEAFALVDVTIFKHALFTIVVPPGVVAPLGLPMPVQAISLDLLVPCLFCDATFATLQAAAVHAARSHQWVNAALKANADTNQCLVCNRIFASRASCRAHVLRSLGKNTCSGSRGSAIVRDAEPLALSCPACAHESSSAAAARVHRLLWHFPPALSNTVSVPLSLDPSSSDDELFLG
jgi:hypothetical protein